MANENEREPVTTGPYELNRFANKEEFGTARTRVLNGLQNLAEGVNPVRIGPEEFLPRQEKSFEIFSYGPLGTILVTTDLKEQYQMGWFFERGSIKVKGFSHEDKTGKSPTMEDKLKELMAQKDIAPYLKQE